MSVTARQHGATCPQCGKSHAIDRATWNLFGPDCWCMKCTKWHHLDFMATTGKRLGLTCTRGCRCGMGVEK